MSEHFIARWSRLKRRVPDATPQPRPAFDPASLPPIETIMDGGDIRAFLQVGVPEHLTLAAMRVAWATDPAIRDFIGIAEAQWDFNRPDGIAGFGPLGDGEAIGHRTSVVTASLSKLPTASALGLGPQPSASNLDPRRNEHLDDVWLGSAEPGPARARPDPPPPHDPPITTTHRRHGGALPVGS